jgi:hypothetical protein
MRCRAAAAVAALIMLVSATAAPAATPELGSSPDWSRVDGAVPYGTGHAVPLKAGAPAWFTDELAARVDAANGSPARSVSAGSGFGWSGAAAPGDSGSAVRLNTGMQAAGALTHLVVDTHLAAELHRRHPDEPHPADRPGSRWRTAHSADEVSPWAAACLPRLAAAHPPLPAHAAVRPPSRWAEPSGVSCLTGGQPDAGGVRGWASERSLRVRRSPPRRA